MLGSEVYLLGEGGLLQYLPLDWTTSTRLSTDSRGTGFQTKCVCLIITYHANLIPYIYLCQQQERVIVWGKLAIASKFQSPTYTPFRTRSQI